MKVLGSPDGVPKSINWMYHAFILLYYYQVSAATTTETTTFKSNLFGSMGANVVVAPNTIDFSNVFDNLDQKLVDVSAV